MNPPSALRLESVTVRSPEGVSILDDVSWSAAAGSVTSVVGPSGSGKSSLLRLLNRLDDASAGSIEILGRSIQAWTPRQLRTTVVWVPQSPTLLLAGTALDVMHTPVKLGVISPREAEERRDKALQAACFDPALLSREASRLSGGERQRLALARALLLEPRVLLLDEPTSSLDGETASRVLAALAAWQREQGSTLVVVTHRLADVRAIGGRLLMLDHGRVAHLGDSIELLESAAGDDIRRLMSGDRTS